MLIGKGIWITDMNQCEGGDPQAIATAAFQAGFSHVCVKIGYATQTRNDSGAKLALKAQLDAVGIALWGWHYIIGDDPDGEAQLGLQETLNLNLAGYILDAEDEYQGKFAQATQFMTDLIAGIGGRPVALSSHRFPTLHPQVPWNEFLSRCTLAMPQVYWEGSNDPVGQLQRSVNEYGQLSATPIVPTGPAFTENGWSPAASEILDFLTAAKASLMAANIFSWDAAQPNQDWWNTITQFQW